VLWTRPLYTIHLNRKLQIRIYCFSRFHICLTQELFERNSTKIPSIITFHIWKIAHRQISYPLKRHEPSHWRYDGFLACFTFPPGLKPTRLLLVRFKVFLYMLRCSLSIELHIVYGAN
jgi:hypothetical protein